MMAHVFLRSCIIMAFLFANLLNCSQSSQTEFPFGLVQDLEKSEYAVGDTISFVLKNNTNKRKDYHVYVSTNDDYNPYYTAYINDDTQWKELQMADIKKAKDEKREPVFSDKWPVKTKYYSIPANGTSRFSFVIHGISNKNTHTVNLVVKDGDPKDTGAIILKKIKIHARWFPM